MNKKDTKEGIKVKIPTQCNGNTSYSYFLKELKDKKYTKDYLLISLDNNSPSNCGLKFDDKTLILQCNSFAYSDLELYEESTLKIGDKVKIIDSVRVRYNTIGEIVSSNITAQGLIFYNLRFNEMLANFPNNPNIGTDCYLAKDLELIKEEPFILPANWYIKINKKNFESITKFRILKNRSDKSFNELSRYEFIDNQGFGYYDTGTLNVRNTELTLDQFIKYILKEPIKKETNLGKLGNMVDLEYIKNKLEKHYDKDDVKEIMKYIIE